VRWGARLRDSPERSEGLCSRALFSLSTFFGEAKKVEEDKHDI